MRRRRAIWNSSAGRLLLRRPYARGHCRSPKGFTTFMAPGMGACAAPRRRQHRRPHEYSLRRHQRYRAHRDAVSVSLFHALAQSATAAASASTAAVWAVTASISFTDRKIAASTTSLTAALLKAASVLPAAIPTGNGATRVIIEAGLAMLDRVRKASSRRPLPCAKADGANRLCPPACRKESHLPEGSLLVDYVAGGGGFGDPIDRAPKLC